MEEDIPLLTVVVTTYNMQDSIEEFINFYRNRVPASQFLVFDNQSTDNTKKVAEDMGAQVFDFNTGNKMDEFFLMNIRNKAWKLVDSEFMLVVDADEFATITTEFLETADWNICKCVGIEIFSEEWLPIEDYTHGELNERYSKIVLFRKSDILETNFESGSHQANPIPNTGKELKWCTTPPFLIHGKWRCWKSALHRQNEIKTKGITDESKRLGINWHYMISESEHLSYFQKGLKNSIKFK
jgi:hypothetical protein